MKKMLLSAVLMLLYVGAYADVAQVVNTIETLPVSNDSNSTYNGSTAAVSAVSVSSTTPTQISLTFNAFALAQLGAGYQMAELVAQNNSAGTIFCGYDQNVTVASGFAIYGLGGERYFKVGKSIKVYCLAAAAPITTVPASILIVGGVAWK